MYKSNYSELILSTLIYLFIVIISWVIADSYSSLILSIIIYLIGHIYCIRNKIGLEGKLLFTYILTAMLFFALLHYLDTIIDYNSFSESWRDEYKFWIISNELSKQNNLINVFKESYSNWQYNEYPGYIFYIGSLAYLADTYIDGNHLLFQFIGSVMWGSLSSIILYRLFLGYMNIKSAYVNTIFFTLLTVILSYSFMFLRDVMVLLFFIYSFYLISNKFSIKNTILLILVVIVVWQIRFEHGLYLILFVLTYIFINLKSKFSLAKATILISLSVGILVVLLFYIQESFRTLSRYSIRSKESALILDDSLGKILFTLPTPIKEFAIFFNSQISPFPPWTSLIGSTNNIYSGIINILPLVYSLFWFVVTYSLMKWILLNGMLKKLSYEVKYMVILSIIFIFIVSQGSSDARRIMCVYPPLYVAFVIMRIRWIPIRSWKRTRNESIVIYLLLIGIYLVAKYI